MCTVSFALPTELSRNIFVFLSSSYQLHQQPSEHNRPSNSRYCNPTTLILPVKLLMGGTIQFRPRSSGNSLFSRAVARQVSSTLRSLTSVFGMGTGGASSPLSPDILLRDAPSKLNNVRQSFSYSFSLNHLRTKPWSSPRSISINQLHVLPHFHL